MKTYLVNFVTRQKVEGEDKPKEFVTPMLGSMEQLTDAVEKLQTEENIVSCVAIYVCTYDCSVIAPFPVKGFNQNQNKEDK